MQIPLSGCWQYILLEIAFNKKMLSYNVDLKLKNQDHLASDSHTIIRFRSAKK